MLNIESIFVAIGLLFTAYELHLSRRSEYIRISHDYKERYDRLNESRQEFYRFYLDRDFDLKRLKKESPELYEKVLLWETRFYWFCYEEWNQWAIRRSIPSYLKRDWEYAIKAAMKNQVHKQVWLEKIRIMDFCGYKEFNEFIDNAIKQGGR